MALDGLFHFSRLPPAQADAENAHLEGIRGQQLVTAVAVSAAVLVVAMIAILMGMASP